MEKSRQSFDISKVRDSAKEFHMTKSGAIDYKANMKDILAGNRQQLRIFNELEYVNRRKLQQHVNQ